MEKVKTFFKRVWTAIKRTLYLGNLKIRNYFSFSRIRDAAVAIGAGMSLKALIVLVLVLAAALFIVGFLLSLDYTYIAILVAVLCALLPALVMMKFQQDYQKYRFTTTVDYMEQMIYSFNKSGKIRESLEDTMRVSKGTIKELIGTMIYIIDNDFSSDNMYQKAFDVLQKEYNCQRLTLLHNFLYEAEQLGGEFEHSLNILLQDIRSWSTRMITYQNDRKTVKAKVTVSIMLAILSCGLMLNLIPDEYLDQIIATNAYQIGTTVILLACILIYFITSKMACRTYMDNELDKGMDSRAVKNAAFVASYNSKDRKKPMIVKLCITLVCCVALIIAKLGIFVPAMLLLGLYMTFSSMLKKQRCVRQTTRDIIRSFPSWLRVMIMYLQTENVQMSIQKSYKLAPNVLKPELKVMLKGLQKDPDSAEPFHNFLKDYNVPNLKLSVSYIYSMSQFSQETMISQLDYLIEQSQLVSEEEEKTRNEDELTGFSLMGLLPMLLVCLKLLLDMLLFLQVIMAQFSSYGSLF